MKRRARRALRRSAIAEARILVAQGRAEIAAKLMIDARVDHRLIGRVTQHWFRHLLATRFRGDIRGAMDQGGWRDERSVMGYVIDASEHRRAIVNKFDREAIGTLETRTFLSPKKLEQKQ